MKASTGWVRTPSPLVGLGSWVTMAAATFVGVEMEKVDAHGGADGFGVDVDDLANWLMTIISVVSSASWMLVILLF